MPRRLPHWAESTTPRAATVVREGQDGRSGRDATAAGSFRPGERETSRRRWPTGRLPQSDTVTAPRFHGWSVPLSRHHWMPLSKLGESLGLALVSTCHKQAASVCCERLEGNSHSPLFDRSKTAAIAGRTSTTTGTRQIVVSHPHDVLGFHGHAPVPAFRSTLSEQLTKGAVALQTRQFAPASDPSGARSATPSYRAT